MKNINNEEVDLGLTLGSRNYRVETRSKSSPGAGVNANSRVDMAFAASDPLSELVWSPHNGLSLKCAHSTLADNKAFRLGNVGPRLKELSPSPSIIRSKKSGNEKVVDDKNLTVSQTMRNGNETFGDDEKGDSCGSKDARIADIAESSKRIAEDSLADGTRESKLDMAIKWQLSNNLILRTRCNQNSTVEINAHHKIDIMGSALPIRSKPQEEKLDDEVTSASGDMYKKKSRMSISIPAPAVIELEESAENDLADLAAKGAHYSGEARLPEEISLPFERSPTSSKICSNRENGKEKVLSDGNICGRSSNDEDESHESMESCNSAGLFLKGVKRQRYDEMQMIGSKRMKRQIEENCGSTSLVRPDSSFMNWISNMMRGISNSNKEESSSLALSRARSNNVCGVNYQTNSMWDEKHGHESPKMGFQTVFQSMYCRDKNMSENGVKKDKYSVEESKELVVAEKRSFENVPRSCHEGDNINSCKQIVLSNKEVNRCNRERGEMSTSDSLSKCVKITTEDTRPDIPLAMNCVPQTNNPRASLWITRLYTRTSRLENYNQITKEACPNANLDCGIADIFSNNEKISEARDASEHEMDGFAAKTAVDFESTHKLTLQLSEKLRRSEALASVFAKRLNALRHMEKRKSSICTLICFFCGETDHDLRKCPELTETELEDLLVKISSLERVEESPCLCIRCFQFDHWAISCPLGPTHRHRRSETRQPFLGSCPSYLTWNEKVSLGKRLLDSNEFPKSATSESENYLEDRQIIPRCNLVNAEKVDTREETFHAIRKLRLSRSDVLRWMDSNVPSSHLNGFFLRLRLAKMEAGLGWTGYHVARITGDTIENSDCESKKSILVDVGGIKSSVESQYVSNHDFLEDEMKAWLSRMVKSGVKIPTLDELNSKIEDRRCLGF